MKNVRKIYRTDALIPSTGFWFGFFSVFNLFPTCQMPTYGGMSDAELDFRAVQADWGVVATDSRRAMRKVAPATSKYTKEQLSLDFNA